MAVDERVVHEIVQRVIANLRIEGGSDNMHGVFTDMNDAIAAAEVAQRTVRNMTLDAREKVISAIRRKINENVEVLANMGVSETGMGNVGDKILKHKLTADKGLQFDPYIVDIMLGLLKENRLGSDRR